MLTRIDLTALVGDTKVTVTDGLFTLRLSGDLLGQLDALELVLTREQLYGLGSALQMATLLMPPEPK